MYQSVVVGTDGSDTAAAAVQHALALATTTGATVHVVTAWSRVPSLVLAAGSVPPTPSAIDDGEWGARLHSQIRSEGAARGVRVTTHAVEDVPARALIETARALDAD